VHNKKHTLDLVLSRGLNTSNICIEDVFLSDYKCILFDLAYNEDPLPVSRVSCSRMVNRLAVENFSTYFDSSLVFISDDDVSVQPLRCPQNVSFQILLLCLVLCRKVLCLAPCCSVCICIPLE